MTFPYDSIFFLRQSLAASKYSCHSIKHYDSEYCTVTPRLTTISFYKDCQTTNCFYVSNATSPNSFYNSIKKCRYAWYDCKFSMLHPGLSNEFSSSAHVVIISFDPNSLIPAESNCSLSPCTHSPEMLQLPIFHWILN